MGYMQTATKAISIKWLFLPWLSLLFTVIVFTVLGVIAQGDPAEALAKAGLDTATAAFGLIVLGTLLAVAVLGFLLKKNGLGWQAVGLRGTLTPKSVLYAILGWSAAMMTFYIVQLSSEAIGLPMFWNENPEFINLDSLQNWILVLIGPVVIASVAEEIIFRGYVIAALSTRFKTTTSVVLSALIFASVHVFFGPGFLLYICLAAFVPAYLYLKFGSLYPAMLMHFFNNFFSYIIVPLLFLRLN